MAALARAGKQESGEVVDTTGLFHLPKSSGPEPGAAPRDPLL
jgi:hypothetical protein